MDFKNYDIGPHYDEMFASPNTPRLEAGLLADKIRSLGMQELQSRQEAAEQAFYDLGITFTVYGHEEGTEKIFPFDIIPRIIGAEDWSRLERGLKQRIEALNLFIDDIYHDQRIIKDKVVPEDVILTAEGYFEECRGINPPGGVWCHITGTDLIRDDKGEFHVLEDNLRSPSGVSYVMANRRILKRTFPQVFAAAGIRPVEDYPAHLLQTMHDVIPGHSSNPSCALLTPGIYNSAYYEHSYLAQQTGVELVEGRDLVVEDGIVYMRTTKGLKPVDVIYRRVGEDFLDPTVFRPDSLLGVPGIMDAYRRGNVTLMNAPGTGVADDKVVYAYVPEIIKYYLDQEAIIPNVPTYLCWKDDDRSYVLDHLNELVVKAANESGGYGMLVGPHSTKEEQDEFARRIKEKPRNYIAQPTIQLSRVPVIVGDSFEGRHVDLRPYVLYGKEIRVIPGGLTRVALKKGSLVVNSSQGGGSKDTWVLSR
ncbi:circularly permuted type 2 ATP-grasp protein [Maridesulfovibrio sp.]|uniref:circularly permuted type 2 ATP-grasp protein n=1 Tax=Maridesulfovibrio sp. TaxID=2795000 RepID=UPI002A18B053|nr:circularly permuted type 2 ATP-grasp protein [Maridesulfovibrio sp.]